MKRLPFLGLLFVLLCFASCWQMAEGLQLSLSFNANDIFVSHSKFETLSNNMKMTVDNQFSFTNFRIGVSYTFGGDIHSKGQRNSNDDIQNRL